VLGVALRVLDRTALVDLLGDDAAQRREVRLGDLLFRVPQIGADQRLAAMKIDFLGGDQDATARRFALHRGGFEQRRVGGDLGAAVDPQGLAQAGHEKDQPDPRAFEQIADRIDPVVAEPVWDQQRGVVENPDKARRIALGRGVAASLGITGRHDDERR